MNHTQGKIGIRELVAITILLIGTKLSDDTPALLYKKLDNAAWMAPIIDGLIVIIPIVILLKLITLYKNKSLLDIIIHLFGKYVGYFILLLLWVISTAAIITDSAIYADIIGTMYFARTPTIVVYGLLMLVCIYGAKRGLESIGSVAWASLPYIKFSLFIALVLTINLGNTSFLFPLFGPGYWEIIKESSLKLSIFVDFLYLCIIAPYIKDTKTFKKGIWISFAIILVEFILGLIAFVYVFDYHTVKMLNYPYHETIRTIRAGFLTNIETFLFPFWLLAAFIRFTVYLYVNAVIFGKVFNIRSFEYVIPILATLYMFIGLIPESPTFTLIPIRETIIIILSPILFFLPIVCLFIAKVKGDFKNEASE